MGIARAVSPKCFFVAWIFAWATAIYLPSVLIALAGLSPRAAGENLLSGTLAVADEVAPAAKLGFGILLAGLLLLGRLRAVRGASGIALDMALAVAAMMVVVAALPQEWSRGFGVGLAGTRFAVLPTVIYAAGALLSGLVFALSEARCARRSAVTRS